MCARELLGLIDSIADYEELMGTSVSGMNKYLYEAAGDVASFFPGQDGVCTSKFVLIPES